MVQEEVKPIKEESDEEDFIMTPINLIDSKN